MGGGEERREGGGTALDLSYKWKTNNRFLLSPAALSLPAAWPTGPGAVLVCGAAAIRGHNFIGG